MIERFQILSGQEEDGTPYYAVLDTVFEIIVAEGSLEEMQEYRALRPEHDKMALWQ